MTISYTMFLIILGSALVTVIPRILPFIFLRKLTLPEVVVKWLSFIPICIFTALIADSFIKQEPTFSFNWFGIIAVIPTVIVALWTKSLSITVVTGVVVMAALRFFF